MTEKRLKLGREGEAAAADFLKKKGYRIIETNFRAKAGEIDIIADKDSALVFIEVKARVNHQFGHPFNAITPAKQKKIVQTARSFMARHRLLEIPARFDVVGVTSDPENSQTFQIELLENAFQIA